MACLTHMREPHVMASDRFDEYCRQKVRLALAAQMAGYQTVTDEVAAVHDRAFVTLSNEWTRTLFDGVFHRTASARNTELPVVSLVFVQSQDGNTGARNP